MNPEDQSLRTGGELSSNSGPPEVQITGLSPLSMLERTPLLTEESPITAQQVTERSTHNSLTDYFNEYVAEDLHGRSNAFYKVAGYEMSSDMEMCALMDSLAVDELPHLTFQATDTSRREATVGVSHFLQHFPNRSDVTVLAVDGDGYCLLHAVSVALVGDESLWSYLRLQLQHELIKRNKTPPTATDATNMKRLKSENDYSDKSWERDLSSDHVELLAAVLQRPILLVSTTEIEVILPKSRPGEPEMVHGSPLVIGMSKARNHYVPIVPKVSPPVDIPLEALLSLPGGVVIHEGEDYKHSNDPVHLSGLLPGGKLTILARPPSTGLQDFRDKVFQHTMSLFTPKHIADTLSLLPVDRALTLLGEPFTTFATII